VCVEADDEIHVTDVEPLLADARRHEGVVASFTKLTHHLELILLGESLRGAVARRVTDEAHYFHEGAVACEYLCDFTHAVTVR